MRFWPKKVPTRSKWPMTTVEVFAPAKINLTLHVTGQRSDGYHLLDSLVAFADIGDRITVAPSDQLKLSLTGPQSSGLSAEGDNLVLRAARFLDPNGRVAITLDKHLPVASGIGGGSANAAATLQALSQLWNTPLPRAEATAQLGADVPMCMTGQTLRMQGIGAEIEPLAPLPPLDIVLVNPGVPLSTPNVFAALDRKTNPPMPNNLPKWATAQNLANWLATQRNDLQPAAISLAPVIGDVLTALDQTGALLTRMSGSGATCFGLFPADQTSASKALKRLRANHPQWWSAQGRLL